MHSFRRIPKSKAFHLSVGAVFGATALIASLHFLPCTDASAILLNVVGSALPCPASAVPAPVVPSGGKVTLTLYPSSSVSLVAKDEAESPFAIHLDEDESGASNTTIQVQPNPGIASVAPVATFTFTALRAGTAIFTLASSSEVLANDGLGTDVLGSVQDASITIE